MNQLPYNELVEQAVLVATMTDPMLLPRIMEVLEPRDFYKLEHQEIYKVICDLQGTADSLTVKEKLAGKTKEYFDTIVAESDRILPSIANALIYAETVKGKAKLRAAINLAQETIALSYQEGANPSEVMQLIEDNFANFIKERVIDDKSESTVEALQDFIKNLSNKVVEDKNGVKTGILQVDLLLHNLEGLVILAARPSVGKTAFAINVARHAVNSAPVVFFSLEQSKDQIFERMLAGEAQVPLEDIRTGAYLDNPQLVADIEKAGKSLEKVMETFHIDDRANIPSNYITSVTRQKFYEWGKVGLIVVDYLHLMRLASTKNQTDALGDACKELRGLGKELNCPVLLLSQLNRGPQNEGGKRINRRPDLPDLRSSGDIEQTADIVMFLHRESYGELAELSPDEDICEVIVRKNRNGRQGMVETKWYPKYMKFADL